MIHYDVIIVGAGVVGCLTARELSKYNLKILLIDKASDVGSGTSAANSALVHAGYDALPGTLKAALNVQGNAMWDKLAAELDFDFKRCGDYVVAIGEEEIPALQTLYDRGKKNGVPEMEIVSAEAVRTRIPQINPQVSGALYAATAGVCDPFGATIAAAENAIQNGVTIQLSTAFENFILEEDVIKGIQTNRDRKSTRLNSSHT